jgi:hypothetical protein
MSFMDRKNILEEGLIDKLIGLLKKSKSKTNDKETKKAYEDAMMHFNKANAILKNNLKKRGIKDRFAGL